MHGMPLFLSQYAALCLLCWLAGYKTLTPQTHVTQITSCDNILAKMEEMLGKFQSDLGNISSEIRALQEQSQSMSVRLRNRKAAEAKLGTFLDNLVLPPALIDGILLAPPDAGFAVCINISSTSKRS